VLTGDLSNTLLRKMIKAGLISATAVLMFFEAAPANAQDERALIYGLPLEELRYMWVAQLIRNEGPPWPSATRL
jgi:hypothetical protein